MNETLEKAKILIVDDISKNIQVLGTILNGVGYQIYVAQNGRQALEKANSIQPDLILLDVMMPEMDGFETCKFLKSEKITEEIPIIFLTAKDDIDSIVEGFNLGGVDYITKPFNKVELLARIHTHLQLKFGKDKILKQDAEHQELLHVLCHDLTNPMGLVLSFMELIEEDPKIYNDVKSTMAAAMTSGLALIDIIREMRAFDEKHQLKLEPINLKKTLEKSISMLQQKFSDKKITVDMMLEEQFEVMAEENLMINSIFNNILTNAIKFSHEASKIQIRSQIKDNRVSLSFRDFGIGMSPRLVRDIFNVTKSTNRPGTNGERGTGFGMPLIQKFIEAFGGKIEVTSKEKYDAQPDDHGTTVRIEFDLISQ